MKVLSIVCRIIAGVLMIGLGVCSFFFPGEALVTFSWIWSILFLVSGVANIVSFIAIPAGTPGRGFLLFGGIVQLVLGIVLVVNGAIFATAVAVTVFRLWILFAGIDGIFGSIEEKAFGNRFWWVSLILGILLLIIGLGTFGVPEEAAFILTYAVGIGIILSGIAVIVRGFVKSPIDGPRSNYR